MSDSESKKPEKRPLTLKFSGSGPTRHGVLQGKNKTVVVEKRRRRVGPRIEKPKAAQPTQQKEPVAAVDKSAARLSGAKAPLPERTESTDIKEKSLALSSQEVLARRAVLEAALTQKEARARQQSEELDALEQKRRIELEKLTKQRNDARQRSEAAIMHEENAPPPTKTKHFRDAKGKMLTRAEGNEAEDEEKEEIQQPPTVFDLGDKDDPLASLGGRLKTKKQFAGKDVRERDGHAKRRMGKLTVVNALDDEERQRSLSSLKRAREREKRSRAQKSRSAQRVVREVVVPDTITVQDLAARMAVRAVDLVRALMKQGQMVTANTVLDGDTAVLIAEDMGHPIKRVSKADVEEGLIIEDADPARLQPRPPVVTVMGHVDHGKTSLLDALRQTRVVSGEAGGITQHIGAYQVHTPQETVITFLDTPGHAAFSQMRARGAKTTDIVVLVVAANDGVMPQTIEAIHHARAAGAPLIVAINKIDLPDANPDEVLTQLLRHEVQVESLGGEVQDVRVSALKKQNLDELLSAIALQAELMELTADPGRKAQGVVIEARLDKARGPQATFLVQKGTLARGDVFVAGAEWGKVRALNDDRGKRVKAAGPSQPVEILGLNGVPKPGDIFVAVESEAKAREIADFRNNLLREKSIAQSSTSSLEQMMAMLKSSPIRELPLILKGDVEGSIEAITTSLEKMSTDEVRVKILHRGVGGVTKSDVILAEASNALIAGFNVRPNADARNYAGQAKIDMRFYSVIYELIDDMKAMLSGMLAPEKKEKRLGSAVVMEIFSIAKTGKVAGCRVNEGAISLDASARLLRDDIVVHDGKLATLRRFKTSVAQVQAGQECGMGFENFQDIRPDDVIECYEVTTISRQL